MASRSTHSNRWRVGKRVFIALVIVLAVGLVAAPAYAKVSSSYGVRMLASDVPGKALYTDPNLVNGWGLAAGPSTYWWVADNGTDRSSLYEASGTPRPLVVSVAGGPTGTVYNPTTSFVVSAEGTSSPAKFLFATEGGKILGWSPTVPAADSTRAVVAVDNSHGGAIYKGLAIGMVDGKSYLYATDFHNGHVDVFDENFARVTWRKAFTDRRLRRGYVPFGIQAIGNRIYVTYAKQDRAKHDEISGAGMGYVDVYTMKGALVRRVATRGRLNAPWGVAMAPSRGFGRYNGCLLVANFGDGTINAYRANKRGVWNPVNTMRTKTGKRLKIDGLWGISFGNGGPSGPTNQLFFAAGPKDESHGAFGVVSVR